jgi:hypothetical protein
VFISVAIVTIKHPEITVLSTVYVYSSRFMPINGVLLKHGVRTCGSNKVVTCARSILASIDSEVEWLKQKYPVYYATLK